MPGRARGLRQEEQDLLAGGDPAALIELRKLVKTFRNAAGEFHVLKGIDAAFYERQFVSIVGRSGSGKSTLLNMITGIDHPTAGLVRIGDTLLHRLDEGRMSVWRGRQMGIVFQFFQLLPMLTLLENVMLPMDFCGVFAPGEREPRALDLLKMVGLEGLESQYPAGVAGGQQQSAAVARALANDPPLLVADEPTGNLDSRTAERVLEIFEEQVALGKTVLMVTHDSTLASRAQRKLVISDGELVNERISSAFPELSHTALLQLSHAAQPRWLAAGETLALGEGAPELVVVTAGELEALAAVNLRGAVEQRGAGNQQVLGRLGAGAVYRKGADRSIGAVRWKPAEQLESGGAFAGAASLRAVGEARVLVVERLPESAELGAQGWPA